MFFDPLGYMYSAVHKNECTEQYAIQEEQSFATNFSSMSLTNLKRLLWHFLEPKIFKALSECIEWLKNVILAELDSWPTLTPEVSKEAHWMELWQL